MLEILTIILVIALVVIVVFASQVLDENYQLIKKLEYYEAELNLTTKKLKDFNDSFNYIKDSVLLKPQND